MKLASHLNFHCGTDILRNTFVGCPCITGMIGIKEVKFTYEIGYHTAIAA